MAAAHDVIVLGGGSAGSAAAAAARKAGARVAMINDGELGGLCILRGCMPTKSMLEAAHAVHVADHLEPFGARLEGRVVTDFGRIMARKNEHVGRFQRAKIAGIEAGGYDVLQGRARFVPGGGVEVDGRHFEARAYVIATGSTPAHVPVPGIGDVRTLTSDDVMLLDTQPERLIVLGAGAIGLELAQFFARVGTEVLLVNRSKLLSHHDDEAGRELTRALEQEPRLRLAVPGSILELRRDGRGLLARIKSGEHQHDWQADAIVLATGRRALLDDLGLEHVELHGGGGGLEHDLTMRTAHPRIFVAGDATGRFQILHLANQEGAVAGHNAAGGQPPRAMDYRLQMQVIFTDPPYATVGLTPNRAQREGHDPKRGRARFPETGRAITMGARHGLWTLLADRESGEILGSSILGPRADELIHEVALLMRYRAPYTDIFDQPWYHPTLSEVMLDLARDLAAQG